MKKGVREKAVLFDTLAYSEGLKEKGIENSETYAEQLSEALMQNIYSKSEVDHMIDSARREAQDHTDKMVLELRKDFHEMQLEIERIGTRTITTIVGILGSLIVLVGAISTFSHAIFH